MTEMKRKLLVFASAFIFAFLMSFTVTTSEPGSNRVGICGDTALAGGTSGCEDNPCFSWGSDPCGGCPQGCTCRWNVTVAEND